MPCLQFTDKWLQSAPVPEKGQVQWFDRTGLPRGRTLCLLIGATGSKGWRVTYYEGGKPKSRKLGFYDPGVPGHMSLAAARLKANAFVPESLVKPEPPDGPTLRAVADDYLRRHVAGLRTRYEVTRKLTVHVLPALGDVSFTEIGRKQVTALLDDIQDRHGAGVADSVLITLRGLMGWFADRHDDYNPPRMKRRSKPVRRKRVLDDSEVRAFWQATDDGSPYSALLRFLLLTGQRRAKGLGLQHGDIVGNVWTIRSEPREKPNAGRLVLPQAVLDIVASQPRLDGNPFVFAGDGGRDIRSFSRPKEMLDAAMRQRIPDMLRWTVHDLRRTCRTKLSQLGVSEEIGERVLGHVLPGIVGIYNQHRYEAEMADALQKLADHIALLVDPPDNVVRLRTRD